MRTTNEIDVVAESLAGVGGDVLDLFAGAVGAVLCGLGCHVGIGPLMPPAPSR